MGPTCKIFAQMNKSEGKKVQYAVYENMENKKMRSDRILPNSNDRRRN